MHTKTYTIYRGLRLTGSVDSDGEALQRDGEGGMDDFASFGQWLRRRRKALDLTQDALARQIGCAIITIQKIEADERRPSREFAERLASLLEVPAAERAAFLLAARAEIGRAHV